MTQLSVRVSCVVQVATTLGCFSSGDHPRPVVLSWLHRWRELRVISAPSALLSQSTAVHNYRTIRRGMTNTAKQHWTVTLPAAWQCGTACSCAKRLEAAPATRAVTAPAAQTAIAATDAAMGQELHETCHSVTFYFTKRDS